MSGLLSVADALTQILDGVEPVEAENKLIPLAEAAERVLAGDLKALRTQPPFPASAMDGYAVRAEDVADVPVELNVIGEAAAGHGFSGTVSTGEAVRIFTGAPVPEVADTILIQENTEKLGGNRIRATETVSEGRYVRPAGLDFTEGETLLKAGRLLDPYALSLAAAMNHAALPVRRRPKVAIIATGDELVLPGENPGPDQIIASNSFGVAAIVHRAGGEAIDLGIAEDTAGALEDHFTAAEEALADAVVTLGGASVGDHDLVQRTLGDREVPLNFWKLAMRPGKPVMFGKSAGGTRYLGLPGNPVSSLVCSLVFLVPLIEKMLGQPPRDRTVAARLGRALPENDEREEYMRATLVRDNGDLIVTPFDNQDSSIITNMAAADALLIRPARAEAANEGDLCRVIALD